MVRTNVILKGELQSMLASTWHSHAALADNLPLPDVTIYTAGYLAALQAVALAYDLNMPELREAAASQRRAREPVTIHDMQL